MVTAVFLCPTVLIMLRPKGIDESPHKIPPEIMALIDSQRLLPMQFAISQDEFCRVGNTVVIDPSSKLVAKSCKRGVLSFRTQHATWLLEPDGKFHIRFDSPVPFKQMELVVGIGVDTYFFTLVEDVESKMNRKMDVSKEQPNQ